MARKQTQPHMTDEDRRFIYNALKKKFDFDEEYPLASLGWCFVREGIDREDYGFLKLKPMLEEMSDFVSMSTKEIGGVSQSMFSLREFEPYETLLDGDEATEDDRDRESSVDSRDSVSLKEKDSKKDKVSQRNNSSKKKPIEQKETEEAVSAEEAADAANGIVPDGSATAALSDEEKKRNIKNKDDAKKHQEEKKKLDNKKEQSNKKDTNVDNEDECKDDRGGETADAGEQTSSSRRSSRTKTSMKPADSSSDSAKAPDAAESKACEEARSAKEGDSARSSGRGRKDDATANDKAAKSSVRRSAKSGASVLAKSAAQERDNAAKAGGVEAGERGKKGASDDASLRRKQKSATPAKEQAANRTERRPRRRVIPGKELERFGYLGTWQEFLETLASLALDEPWDFNDAGLDVRTRRFDILHNYIRYTFYRLTLEDKVGFSSDEDFAAWNTGLVDKHYEDIYACFEPSDPNDPDAARYSWTFSGFCTAGTGRLGKRLVREFNPLPQPASYLERKEDLLFDLDREVVCDVHHIVVDNVHRLPVNFLRDELASSQECLGILAGVEELSDGARGERFEKLRAAIENDTRLFNRLSTSINAAIAVAKRQVRWNYKTAVPAYYPRTNSMNLLLPLILTDSPTPDVALVVELQKSGNYQGQTIVTMAQAYRDARLLCRPYIDWLSPASIIDAAEEKDEEE
ncbi:MAG: DUF3825 domain-containing protein [Slackia sp.]|nr:DUF3825 domain-containing protein [Slackia sp.]